MSGEADQTKGRVKKAAGDLTGDEEMKNEGRKDETAGKVKDAVGDVKRKADDAIDKIKDKSK
jgi:uncharacterized protein YjbJ (UPF0337 family)